MLTAIVIAFAITVLLLTLAVTGRDDDAVADGHEAPDPLEQAAADARFPREELRAAAARLGREAEARDGGRA